MTAPTTHIKPRVLAVLMIALISTVIYPEMSKTAHAAEGNQSLVFELKPNALKENSSIVSATQLQMNEVAANDALVQAVQKYLEAKKSPLAPYASEIVLLPNWEQALGITYVESNFCAKAANFNCGSVGVKPGHSAWKKFETPLDGFRAVSVLLEKPLYKNKYNTCKKKMGVYVVPGSNSWLRGCEKVETDMKAITTQAENTNRSLATAAQPTMAISNKEIALAK